MATRSRKKRRSARETGLSQPPLPAASARFSSIVISGALPRIGSWNSRPIFRARRYSGSSVMSSPSSTSSPLSVMKLPAIAPNSVDFPAPFAPMIVIKSPLRTSSDRSSNAFFASVVPRPKVFVIWEIFSILCASFPCGVLFSGGRADIAPSDTEWRSPLQRPRQRPASA